MATYVVKMGRFGSRKQYGIGDTVELSPEDAKGFLDKLVLVTDVLVASTFIPEVESIEEASGIKVRSKVTKTGRDHADKGDR